MRLETVCTSFIRSDVLTKTTSFLKSQIQSLVKVACVHHSRVLERVKFQLDALRVKRWSNGMWVVVIRKQPANINPNA